MTTTTIATLDEHFEQILELQRRCVTEIATRNRVSVRAHERMGFEALSTYSDGREEWVIVAWDLSRFGP